MDDPRAGVDEPLHGRSELIQGLLSTLEGGQLDLGRAPLAHAVHRLGNADAITPMGGLEALGKELGEGLSRVADAMGSSDD